jgi:glycosyltransferase involved in cell wall biosynthesis
MRILQVSSARSLGGGERHVIDLANALTRRGHEVFVALAPSSPIVEKLIDLPPENVTQLPMRNAFNISTASRLTRFIRERRIEIVHAHIARDYPLAALVSARGSAQLILTRHLLFPLNGVHRLILRRAKSVIAVSGAVAESLTRARIFRRDQIVVINNGIDVDHFSRNQPIAAARKRLCVGTVGQLAPIKGQEDFIRAAAILCAKRSDVDFVIAGEDKLRSGKHRIGLASFIAELGLTQRVQLLGWIEDLSELLSTFDVFVSPARSESFGLSIVEAMAAGVPVIATASGGACEIIDPGVTGLLVPIAGVTPMADAISSLLDDPARRESLAENARRVARERFSLPRMVDAVEVLYQRALD